MAIIKVMYNIVVTYIGALTKNIVAMKEHLEGDLDKDAIPTSAMPAISEAQRHKEREIVTKEVRRIWEVLLHFSWLCNVCVSGYDKSPICEACELWW